MDDTREDKLQGRQWETRNNPGKYVVGETEYAAAAFCDITDPHLEYHSRQGDHKPGKTWNTQGIL